MKRCPSMTIGRGPCTESCNSLYHPPCSGTLRSFTAHSLCLDLLFGCTLLHLVLTYGLPSVRACLLLVLFSSLHIYFILVYLVTCSSCQRLSLLVPSVVFTTLVLDLSFLLPLYPHLVDLAVFPFCGREGLDGTSSDSRRVQKMESAQGPASSDLRLGVSLPRFL